MTNGYIIIITRAGNLGRRYPLNSSECLFGQGSTCVVRVHVANVAKKHCVISVEPDKQAYIKNLSPSNTTFVNNKPLGSSKLRLKHADVITVGDRHFRWEYPSPSLDSGTVSLSTTSAVQIPMADIKSKNYYTPQNIKGRGEPSLKRRKTLSDVTDFNVVETRLSKPMNKRLQALKQSASSPKTFRVLLKTASKRKSLNSIPKTTNNKVVSTKVQRSKSLSSLNKLSHKSPNTKSSKLKSLTNKAKTSEVLCTTPEKSQSIDKSSSEKAVESPSLSKRTPTRSFDKLKSAKSSNNSLSKELNKTKLSSGSPNGSISPFKIKASKESINHVGLLKSESIESPSSSRKTPIRSLELLKSPAFLSTKKLNNNSPSNPNTSNLSINGSGSISKFQSSRVSALSGKITKSLRLSRSSTTLQNTPVKSIRNSPDKTLNKSITKTNIDNSSRSSISLAKIGSPETTGNSIIDTNISGKSGKSKTPAKLTPKGNSVMISSDNISSEYRCRTTKTKSSDTPDTSHSFDLAYQSSPEHSLNSTLVISNDESKSPRGKLLKIVEKNKSSINESELLNLSGNNTPLKKKPNKKNGFQTIEDDFVSGTPDSEDNSLLSLDKTKSERDTNDSNVHDNKRLGRRSSSKTSDNIDTSIGKIETRKTLFGSLKNKSLMSQEDHDSTPNQRSSTKSSRTLHSLSFLDTDPSMNDSCSKNNDLKTYVHDRSLERKNSLRNKSSTTQSQNSTAKKNVSNIVQESHEKFGPSLKSPSSVSFHDNSPPKVSKPVAHPRTSSHIGSSLEFDRIGQDTTTVSVGKRRSTRKSVLRSSFSSSNNTVASDSKYLLPKSSTTKSSVKRKLSDFEARAEQAAKLLKMETPKSLSKNKVAALLVCHGRSPKNIKPKPLFSEVLKSHLSAVKRNQPKVSKYSAAVRANVKRTPFQPTLEIPKTFNFHSTGHANSPETIVITNKKKKTPAPKTRKGRKSEVLRLHSKAVEQDLEGVNELFKTPSKSILSLFKPSSSLKKTKSKVRFSLQNDVQSPSGRRSSVKHSEEPAFFGSPVVSSKRYVGTPRPGRFSELSLLHTSIIEESPLAEEINNSNLQSRKSRSSLRSKSNNQSFDYSVYSPSSPTLQFSKISFTSEEQAINNSQNSYTSEITESPKRKRSLLENSSPISSSIKLFSLETVSNSKSSTIEDNTSFSKFTRTPNSNVSTLSSFSKSISGSLKSTRSSSSDSFNKSSEFKFSPNSSIDSKRSGRKSSISGVTNISQIPLPPESPKIKGNESLSLVTSPSQGNKCSRGFKKLNAGMSFESDNPKTMRDATQRRSKSKSLNSSDNSIELSVTSPLENNDTKSESILIHSSLMSSKNNTTNVFANATDIEGRISSTPKTLIIARNIFSPVNSPITKMSIENETQYVEGDERSLLLDSSSLKLPTDNADFKTPLTLSGRKSKRGSARINDCNISLLTPEGQVPVATVRPSARKRQVNESVSSVAESISLSSFSLSHEVSRRSLDRNLDNKMFDSRVSSDTQLSENVSAVMSPLNNTTPSTRSGSSTNRKRKSSANPKSLADNSFDFSNVATPKVPKEMFVSAISNVDNNLSNVEGVKRMFNPKKNSPISSYIDVKGVKRLLKTPQPPTPVANYTRVEGIKNLFKQSPVPDYTNVIGIKRIYAAQHEPNYMNVKGVRRIFKDNKMPNSPDLSGVEVLFESPKKNKVQQYPKPLVKVPPMTRSSSIKTLVEKMETDLTEPTAISRNVMSATTSTSRSRQIITSDEKSELNSSPVGQKKTRCKIVSELNTQVDFNKKNIEVETKEKEQENIKQQIKTHIYVPEEINGTSELNDIPTSEIHIKRTQSNIDITLVPAEQSKQRDSIIKNRYKRSNMKLKHARNSSMQEINTHLDTAHECAPISKRTRRGKQLDLDKPAEVSNDEDKTVKQIRTRGRLRKHVSESNEVSKIEAAVRSKRKTTKNKAVKNIKIPSTSKTTVLPKSSTQVMSGAETFSENDSNELSISRSRGGKLRTEVNDEIMSEIDMAKSTIRSMRSTKRNVKNQTQESNEETAKSVTLSKEINQSITNLESYETIDPKIPSRSRSRKIEGQTYENNKDAFSKATSTIRSKRKQQSETDIESSTSKKSKGIEKSRSRIVKNQIKESNEDVSAQSPADSTTRSKRKQPDITESIKIELIIPERSRSRTANKPAEENNEDASAQSTPKSETHKKKNTTNKQSETNVESSSKSQATSRSKSRKVKNQNQGDYEDISALVTAKLTTRSRRYQQSEIHLESSTKIEPDASSRSRRKRETNQTEKSSENRGTVKKSTHSKIATRSLRGKQSDLVLENLTEVKKTELRSKSKKKRAQNSFESQTGEMDMEKSNVASSSEVNIERELESNVEKVKSRKRTAPETKQNNIKKSLRGNKIQESPKQLNIPQNIKGKKDKTIKSVPQSEDGSLKNSSRQSSSKISPENRICQTSKISKRVQFNRYVETHAITPARSRKLKVVLACEIVNKRSPEMKERNVKKSDEKPTEARRGVTKKSLSVKTKAAQKSEKLSSKRKSSIPLKSPPSKRMTRSRN